jgi:hypothetical protein
MADADPEAIGHRSITVIGAAASEPVAAPARMGDPLG